MDETSKPLYMLYMPQALLDGSFWVTYNEKALKGAFHLSIPYSRTFLFGIPWYSVLIVLGVVVAVLLAEREEKRLGLPMDTTLDLALVVIPCGIVGARLYYVLMSWETFAKDPVSILFVWQGGIAIYGAVIGGALGALAYALRKKMSFFTLADMIVPGLLLAQTIGRWGNYFNMEAYGPVIENAMYQFFPLGVQIPQADGWQWHMATFFYESLWNGCGFVALWLLRKHQRHRGNVLCWYLLIYGSGRFVIEQLRQDSLYLFGVRASQWLSLMLCAIAAFGLLWRACRLDRPDAFRKCFPFCLAAAAAAIARWFWLDNGVVYTVLVGVALLCAGWVFTGVQKGRGAYLLTLPLLFLPDLLCMLAAVQLAPGEQFLHLLHTLVCSATLPIMIGWLIRAVHNTARKAGEEEEKCPSEI